MCDIKCELCFICVLTIEHFCSCNSNAGFVLFVCLFKQKIEARVAADEDLKLADLLKYYLRESQAAKVWHIVTVEVNN